MPRTAGVHYPGGIYHLISRCVNKRFLIEGSQEREKYLPSLCHALSHVDTIVRAYCLMSNHVGRFLESQGDGPVILTFSAIFAPGNFFALPRPRGKDRERRIHGRG